MGDVALNQSLTVVLPMYNRERQLRSSILEILELSPTIKFDLQIVVVDDGSSDETYETACEMARSYPQITVLRQSVRQGLGAALNLVRHRLNVEMVMVHDGVSPLEASQIRAAIESTPLSEGTLRQSMRQAATSVDSVGSRRFASIRALHDSMEHVHRAVSGFTWLRLEKPIVPRRRVSSMGTAMGSAASDSQQHPATLPISAAAPRSTEI
jgi:cellulose synthase/poly-beta-1,6-N-acetylglucosamine synthase-like glycosyltransferase